MEKSNSNSAYQQTNNGGRLQQATVLLDVLEVSSWNRGAFPQQLVELSEASYASLRAHFTEEQLLFKTLKVALPQRKKVFVSADKNVRIPTGQQLPFKIRVNYQNGVQYKNLKYAGEGVEEKEKRTILKKDYEDENNEGLPGESSRPAASFLSWRLRDPSHHQQPKETLKPEKADEDDEEEHEDYVEHDDFDFIPSKLQQGPSEAAAATKEEMERVLAAVNELKEEMAELRREVREALSPAALAATLCAAFQHLTVASSSSTKKE
ncbi:hypothetical protein QOT17_005685 [Balamuthia mandrillaris]